MPEPKKFRVREEKALEASLMKYLEGDEYKRLREEWIPKLLSMAEHEQPAGIIAMFIRGTVIKLSKDHSPEAARKTYFTPELLGLFFDSEEVAKEAWEQIPNTTSNQLERTNEEQSPIPMTIFAKVVDRPHMLRRVGSLAGGSDRAGRREEEVECEVPSLVDTLSFDVSPDIGPDSGPYRFAPTHSGPLASPPGLLRSSASSGLTSFGIVEQSEDWRSIIINPSADVPLLDTDGDQVNDRTLLGVVQLLNQRHRQRE